MLIATVFESVQYYNNEQWTTYKAHNTKSVQQGFITFNINARDNLKWTRAAELSYFAKKTRDVKTS